MDYMRLYLHDIAVLNLENETLQKRIDENSKEIIRKIQFIEEIKKEDSQKSSKQTNH